ncbi:MAG: HepT-like ribonuclease domain-containing protein [Ilumatobacteraceae bacterium]
MRGDRDRHVSDETRQAHPETPWRDIIGTRVILAHAYFHIDQDVIGQVVDREAPALRSQLLEAADDVLGD